MGGSPGDRLLYQLDAYLGTSLLVVCHNRRIHSNRVFKDLAKRGKNSIGWFFGFKLHIIINDEGELLAFKLIRLPTSR